MSILETIEAFNVVRNAYKVVRLSNFVENIINKNSYEPARTFRDLWSLVMFCTRVHTISYTYLRHSFFLGIHYYTFLACIDKRNLRKC